MSRLLSVIGMAVLLAFVSCEGQQSAFVGSQSPASLTVVKLSDSVRVRSALAWQYDSFVDSLALVVPYPRYMRLFERSPYIPLGKDYYLVDWHWNFNFSKSLLFLPQAWDEVVDPFKRYVLSDVLDTCSFEEKYVLKVRALEMYYHLSYSDKDAEFRYYTYVIGDISVRVSDELIQVRPMSEQEIVKREELYDQYQDEYVTLLKRLVATYSVPSTELRSICERSK